MGERLRHCSCCKSLALFQWAESGYSNDWLLRLEGAGFFNVFVPEELYNEVDAVKCRIRIGRM